jgi:hypothetical protein
LTDNKVTVGDVTFACEITGSDKDGFNIIATKGKTDKKCRASCTLTKKDGSTKTWESPERTVRGGDAPATQWFYGEGGISGAPLSNPEVKATCE